MSTNTTNMAMGKAVDGDNAKTYLETTLGAALDTIDAHDHSTNAKGLPVTRGTAMTITSGLILTGGGINIDNTVAPTVASGHVGIGGTTTATATLGANGALPSQVAGYWIINVSGTIQKVPYYNA